MGSLELFLAFLLAAALLAVTPGPALLFVTAQTLAHGRRAGFMAVLGVHLGGYVHIAAAALGLAVLIKTVPTLYAALKITGAIYLVWIGIGMLRSAARTNMRTEAAEPAAGTPKPRNPRRTFVQSIVVQLLNPKVAIFYVAFLPQFTDPASTMPIGLQFAILGIIINILFLAADSASVLLADRIAGALRRSGSASRRLQQIGGCVLASACACLHRD
ncbi:MAG: LysE family translocator [Geminicoccaceae bacterium]